MKTYLIHHTPRTAGQDTWAVSFSLPYIATAYARAGDGLWYVETWLTAEQIKRRLAVLFDDRDELLIQELGRDGASLNANLSWLAGRLEEDEAVTLPASLGPRAAWVAFQSLIEDIARPFSAPFSGAVTASSSGNLRAA